MGCEGGVCGALHHLLSVKLLLSYITCSDIQFSDQFNCSQTLSFLANKGKHVFLYYQSWYTFYFMYNTFYNIMVGFESENQSTTSALSSEVVKTVAWVSEIWKWSIFTVYFHTFKVLFNVHTRICFFSPSNLLCFFSFTTVVQVQIHLHVLSWGIRVLRSCVYLSIWALFPLLLLVPPPWRSR